MITRNHSRYPGLLAVFVLLALLVSACSTGLTSSSDNSGSSDPVATAESGADQNVETTAAEGDSDENTGDSGSDEDVTNGGEDDVNDETASPADQRSAVELAVEEVRPAVVFLSVQVQQSGAFGMPEEREGVGSGVIFDEEGFVLTNNHVIAGATTIDVVLPDGRSFEGEVVGRSPDRDLAIVEIQTDEDLPVAQLGTSENLRIGQTVVAIGNALGLPGGPTVTTGVVSATGRTIEGGQGQPPMENLLQTDAAINPGNSGGPLINLNSEVIGINTARIQQAEGIGFAVPVDTARQFITQVVEQEPQPFIGISGMDLSAAIAQQYQLPVERGILIVQVNPGSPAEEVGMQAGDILLAIDGATVETVQQLQNELQNYEPGDEVTLLLNREGSETEVTLTLGESPIVQ